jgi:hypothetical protein
MWTRLRIVELHALRQLASGFKTSARLLGYCITAISFSHCGDWVMIGLASPNHCFAIRLQPPLSQQLPSVRDVAKYGETLAEAVADDNAMDTQGRCEILECVQVGIKPSLRGVVPMRESGSFLCVGDLNCMYMTSMKNSRGPVVAPLGQQRIHLEHVEEHRLAKTWRAWVGWPLDEQGQDQNTLGITCVINLKTAPGSVADGTAQQCPLNGDCKPTGCSDKLARVNPSDILEQRGESKGIHWILDRGLWGPALGSDE